MSEYITLEQLRGAAAHRLEDDLAVEGFGTFRVQALTGAEFNRIRRKTKEPDMSEGQDRLAMLQLAVAYGLVQPDVGAIARRDEDEALTLVNALPLDAQSALGTLVLELTQRKASEGYKELFAAAASPNGAAATPTSISN